MRFDSAPPHKVELLKIDTMNKYFSLLVVCLGTPIAIGALAAMFFNPVHIFTAAVLCSMLSAALYEPDEDGENLLTALRRVTQRKGRR